MDALSGAESRIIRSMLLKQDGPASPFLKQLEFARVKGRRHTGVGVFVNLLVGADAAAVDRVNTEVSEDYRTSLGAPLDLVGFTLFIRNGYLSFLEGYTFGDAKWPDGLLEDWLVLDAV